MPYVRKVTAVRKVGPLKRGVYKRGPFMGRPYTKQKYAPVKAPVRKARVSSKRSTGSSSLGTAIGSAIGMALGGPGGGALGGMVGNAGGNFLSSIFGHGDYGVSNLSQIKENNIALSNSAQAPQFGTGKVAVNLKHREFLGDVLSSSTAGAFNITTYPIQPGLPVTFPWLSGVVADSFQQYRINGMTFEFRSMSADALNSVNTSLGSVIMATDYDSADVPFTSKQQMENTEYGVSCKPSTNMMHAIECARPQTVLSELYIRAYANPPNSDIRMYDMGKFYIATVGCQGTNVNLGELWVTYDIDVFKAIQQPPGYGNPYAQYVTANATAAAPLGTSRIVNQQDLLGLTFTNNQIQFPLSTQVGATYLLSLDYVASTTSAFNHPTVTSGNGMYISGAAADLWSPSPGAVTSQATLVLAVQYKGGGSYGNLPYINVSNFTWAVTSILETDIIVNQVNGTYWPGTFTLQIALLPPEEEESPEYTVVEEMKTMTIKTRNR